MQKKLLGMAVAAALAVPTAVLAQSAVTISGTFKVGVDSYKIKEPGAGRAGLKTRETRLTDNSSQIHFNITEDLGGGLAAIAKLDQRFQPDGGGSADNASGNTWVGIRGAGFGTVTLGRHDLHYGKQPDDTSVKGALMASSISLMDFAAAGSVAIAGATRTHNVIRWDSPNWGGVNVTAAYSTNPTAASEADLGAGGLGGNAWNLNPSFTGPNFQVGLSVWNQKADAPSATNGKQKSNVLYGFMRFGAIKAGAAFHQAEIESTAAGGGKVSDRDAFTIPVSWTAGRNTIAGHFTQARDDDAIAGDQKAKMYAVSYAYDFSKRTAISFTYAQIKNEAGAAYDLFTNKTPAGFGSTNSAVAAGEDPQLLAVTVRHAF